MDGSYVTTEWFVFFYFPIVPIRSLRVRYHGRDDNSSLIVSSFADRYTICEITRPRFKQVLFTYAFACMSLLWFAFVLWNTFEIEDRFQPRDFQRFITELYPILKPLNAENKV